MRKFAKILTLFFVLITILISGCTGRAETTSAGFTSNGVEIKDLKAYGSFAGEGSAAYVSFNVVNDGGARAENVCAQVFGQTWIKRDSESEPTATEPTAWYELEDETQCSDGVDMRNKVGDVRGDRYSVSDSFNTSDVPNPVSSGGKEYPIYARVYSKYKTRAIAHVDTLDSSDFNTRQSQGKLTQKAIPYEVTSGPVKVTIEGEHPIRVSNDRLQLRMTIQNVGGGTLFRHSAATGLDGYKNLATTDYNYVTILSVSPKGGAGTSSSTCDNKEIRVPIGSEGGQATCTVTIEGLGEQSPTQVDLQIDLEYGYMNEYKTSVTIKQNAVEEDLPTGEFSRGMLKAIPYLSNLI